MRIVTAIAITLLVPALVWAVGSDHGNEPVSNEKWPKGLAELVNVDNRVHGYFVNWEDVFFFRGDTRSLNAFLDRYSRLPDTQLQVVLHAGKLQVKSPWDEQPRDMDADWRLYATPFTRDQVQAGGVKPGPFVTRVDVWLGESVKLDELQVPATVSVESGGEIEAFVKRHQDSK